MPPFEQVRLGCHHFAPLWQGRPASLVCTKTVIGRSWRADETYIKVNGGWMFLYRAVDEKGRTVGSYLSRTRDKAAARIFFRQALKRHGELRSITLDGFEPSHAALRSMGMRNEFNYRWANPVKIRSSK